MTERNRCHYGAIALVILLSGLGSRSAYVPTAFLRAYAGDTLWTMMAYTVAALLLPRAKPMFLFITALAVSFGVETSQLYHAPWIDAVRATRLGGLVLGFGFLWSDLACYTVGAFIMVILDSTVRFRFYHRAHRDHREKN